MKVEEAVRLVEIVFRYSSAIHDGLKPAEKIAIEAMKKQVAMKPYFENECFCSVCNSEIVSGTDYCWNCGQRLKWTED